MRPVLSATFTAQITREWAIAVGSVWRNWGFNFVTCLSPRPLPPRNLFPLTAPAHATVQRLFTPYTDQFTFLG